MRTLAFLAFSTLVAALVFAILALTVTAPHAAEFPGCTTDMECEMIAGPDTCTTDSDCEGL